MPGTEIRGLCCKYICPSEEVILMYVNGLSLCGKKWWRLLKLMEILSMAADNRSFEKVKHITSLKIKSMKSIGNEARNERV